MNINMNMKEKIRKLFPGRLRHPERVEKLILADPWGMRPK